MNSPKQTGVNEMQRTTTDRIAEILVEQGYTTRVVKDNNVKGAFQINVFFMDKLITTLDGQSLMIDLEPLFENAASPEPMYDMDGGFYHDPLESSFEESAAICDLTDYAK
jgi:hypothetical protein